MAAGAAGQAGKSPKVSKNAPKKRPRGASRAFWEPPGEAPGAHLAPKRAPEASRSHFGTNLGAKKEPRGFILEAFLAKRWPRNAWLTEVVGGVGEAIVNTKHALTT